MFICFKGLTHSRKREASERRLKRSKDNSSPHEWLSSAPLLNEQHVGTLTNNKSLTKAPLSYVNDTGE